MELAMYLDDIRLPFSDSKYREILKRMKDGRLRPFILLDRDGQIIDGRYQYKASKFLGIAPILEEYEGDRREIRWNYVIDSINEKPLSPGQRAALIVYEADKQGMLNTHGGDRKEDASGLSQKELAKLARVCDRHIQRAVKVLTFGSEYLLSVYRNEISLTEMQDKLRLELGDPW